MRLIGLVSDVLIVVGFALVAVGLWLLAGLPAVLIYVGVLLVALGVRLAARCIKPDR